MNLEELRKRAEAYRIAETFVFAKEVTSQRIRLYNGYITKVHEDLIIIFDIEDKREIPLPVDFIVMLEPSERNESVARNIWGEWKDGK